MNRIPLWHLTIVAVASLSCNPLVPSQLFVPAIQVQSQCEAPSEDEVPILRRFITVGSSRRSIPNTQIEFVVFDSTVSRDASWIINRIPGLRDTASMRDLVARFNNANIRRYAFCPLPYPNARTVVIKRNEFDAAFRNHGREAWDVFYKQFPVARSVLAFSRVGFSSDSSLAMIYLEAHCGSLCGSGAYEIYKSVDGEWLHWRTVIAWMS